MKCSFKAGSFNDFKPGARRPQASARLVFLNCFCVDVCVCLHPRLLITSGTILTSYDWLNQLYSCCMAIVISIGKGHVHSGTLHG